MCIRVNCLTFVENPNSSAFWVSISASGTRESHQNRNAMLGPWNLDWVDKSGPGPSMWLSGDSPHLAFPTRKYLRKTWYFCRCCGKPPGKICAKMDCWSPLGRSGRKTGMLLEVARRLVMAGLLPIWSGSSKIQE
jgi:hypothetical protein